MMRKLLAIAWNDIRLQFTDRSEIVFFLILPLVFTAVLAGSYSGNEGGDNRYPLLVVDQDQSALSAQLVAALEAGGVVKPSLKTAEDAEAEFVKKDAYIPALVTIPAGFSDSVAGGHNVALNVRRAAGDNRALAVEQSIRSAADDLSAAVVIARASSAEAERVRPFADAAARQAYYEQSLTLAQAQLKTAPARVEARQSELVVRQSINSAELSSAGQLVTWVLITLIGASAVFVMERVDGTLGRMLSTPTSKATIIGGKIVGRLGAGLFQMTLLIVFGALVFNVPWGRSPLALAAIMVSFALAAVALGVLLATIAKTTNQAGWMTIMFAMVGAALGGAWWPLEITPPLYQTVVKALPTTWAMAGIQDVLVRGQGISAVLAEVAVLLGFAAVFFTVGVRRLRFE